MPSVAHRSEHHEVVDQLNRIINQLWQRHQGEFQPTQSWSPQINIYRLTQRLEVCVDLAGVDRRKIEVRVESGRLTIRGERATPEPVRESGETICIMCMEIDHGPFTRVLNLPGHVELNKVESEYRDGLLWIRLPLRKNK